jgi:nucleoside-diphosphate-sugar epimerase
MSATPRIAVLGASGLIGQEIASRLAADGPTVVPVARRFAPAQKAAFGEAARECPVVDLDAAELGRMLAELEADVVVNCIGVLHGSRRRGTAAEVHVGFVARLVQAMAAAERPCLLVHVSIPGREAEDLTAFATSKREAERVIAAGPVPFVILRPGFVIAPAAYGGGALVRALAALPFALPEREASRPFAATDVNDIARTVAAIARRWGEGERHWRATWDVTERAPSTVGEVVDAFRRRFGGPAPRLRLPSSLMAAAARAGDLAAHLGWSPPVRGTALAEMRRGVEGDPGLWIAATGIEPASLAGALSRLPATVQERWFARLYLAKPLILATLVVFWAASGLIALTVAFDAAVAILTAHGFPPGPARAVTVASGLADVLVGAAIAFRRTCRCGLAAGIGLSLFYMAGAALVTPDLWVEPLGALVKTGPAIVLMLVALAIADER